MPSFRVEHYFGDGKAEKVVYMGTVKAGTAEAALKAIMRETAMWVVEARTSQYATALDLTTPEHRYNALVAEPI